MNRTDAKRKYSLRKQSDSHPGVLQHELAVRTRRQRRGPFEPLLQYHAAVASHCGLTHQRSIFQRAHVFTAFSFISSAQPHPCPSSAAPGQHKYSELALVASFVACEVVLSQRRASDRADPRRSLPDTVRDWDREPPHARGCVRTAFRVSGRDKMSNTMGEAAEVNTHLKKDTALVVSRELKRAKSAG